MIKKRHNLILIFCLSPSKYIFLFSTLKLCVVYAYKKSVAADLYYNPFQANVLILYPLKHQQATNFLMFSSGKQGRCF